VTGRTRIFHRMRSLKRSARKLEIKNDKKRTPKNRINARQKTKNSRIREKKRTRKPAIKDESKIELKTTSAVRRTHNKSRVKQKLMKRES